MLYLGSVEPNNLIRRSKNQNQDSITSKTKQNKYFIFTTSAPVAFWRRQKSPTQRKRKTVYLTIPICSKNMTSNDNENCLAWPRPKPGTKFTFNTHHHHHHPPHKLLRRFQARYKANFRTLILTQLE